MQQQFYIELDQLALSDNFEYVSNCDTSESTEKKSGRLVKRKVIIIGETSDLSTASESENLQTLVEVVNETTSVKGKNVTTEKRYYISSLIESAQEFGALCQASLERWIYALDIRVRFKEDAFKANTLNSGLNLGTMRRTCINIKNNDPELKAIGMAELRRKCCWTENSNVIRKIVDVFFKHLSNLYNENAVLHSWIDNINKNKPQ